MEIIRKDEAGVCTLILNRPSVYNSFNGSMALQLQAALDQCFSDDEVRVVVLTGEGKAFCAGQDLGEAIDPNGPGLAHIVEHHYNPIILKITQMNKPVIAAVNGVAAGAGANIALACDFVIAKNSASFIQAFSKIGLIPDSGGTFILPRLIGQQKAMALMMTGEKVSAQDAEQMNMIYKSVDEESFDAELTAFAIKLANMPTKALALTKAALHASWNNTLEEQLALELDYQVTAGNTSDFAEGVAAFLEKRNAIFTGK
jgi:2-(1,2-epoxy-1,2-dihydrophenyl)acetyl-CoA isomerase